jgi:predicted nuclease of predicted toxin-antitoxin system
VKILIDMNLSPRWAEFLGGGGHECVHWSIRADNLSPSAIGAVILRAIKQLEAELRSGALVTVDPSRARVTLLPLPSTLP